MYSLETSQYWALLTSFQLENMEKAVLDRSHHTAQQDPKIPQRCQNCPYQCNSTWALVFCQWKCFSPYPSCPQIKFRLSCSLSLSPPGTLTSTRVQRLTPSFISCSSVGNVLNLLVLQLPYLRNSIDSGSISSSCSNDYVR